MAETKTTLRALAGLVGKWTTTATHHALPGVVVHGTSVIEWLEGEQFLIHRARTDHPDFPDSIAIIGFTDRDRVEHESDASLTMHYYDSRGVFREFEASIDATTWRMSRLASGFSQRFVGTFTDGGATIVGRWQLCEDDVHWRDDLEITYRRDA